MIQHAKESQWAAQGKVELKAIREVSDGPICLERMFPTFRGAPQCSDHAAVTNAIRVSQHTCSGI